MDIEQRIMQNETIEIKQPKMEFAINDPYKERMEYLERKTDYLMDTYNKIDDEFFHKYCMLRLALLVHGLCVIGLLVMEILEVC